MFPGSGSPEFPASDEPAGFSGFFLPLEASVAPAAEFLRFAISCLQCTIPFGSTFSSAPSHYCCGLALPEGIPPGPATGPAYPGGLNDRFHRAAGDAESETDPSGLSCPLSRYRPGLQIFYSVKGEIRPADRQRLLSAYPAAFAAWSLKEWLPSPFTVLPALSVFTTHTNSCLSLSTCQPADFVSPLSATRISALSYTALSGLHWKPDCFVPPERKTAASVSALLRLPLRGIPGYSLFSKGVCCSGGKRCTFDLHPSGTAAHFLPSGIPEHSRVCSAGHCHGYPHGFSPMQAFRLLTYRKLSPLRTVDIPLMH